MEQMPPEWRRLTPRAQSMLSSKQRACQEPQGIPYSGQGQELERLPWKQADLQAALGQPCSHLGCLPLGWPLPPTPRMEEKPL